VKKYLAYNLFLLVYLALVDMFCRMLPKRAKNTPIQRILLCNIAHLGDVVLARTFLPQIKAKFPESQIGFLISQNSQIVLADNPCVDFMHILDHWKLHREPIHLVQKMLRYRRQKKRVIDEIKNTRYDLAIALSPFFPNAIDLLWQAKIPQRIGYESGGFGPLLTTALPWKAGTHILEGHKALLRCAPLHIENFASDVPILKKNTSNDVVVHMGSMGRHKEWRAEDWLPLIAHFAEEKIPVVFTGQGERENTRIQKIIQQTGWGKNLCDQLEWNQFCSTLQKARLVVSVDSVASHLAAQLGTQVIVIPKNRDLRVNFLPQESIVCQNPHAVIKLLFQQTSNKF